MNIGPMMAKKSKLSMILIFNYMYTGLNVLLCKCKEYDLIPKTLCQLFDAFVSPILNYSCEIWGYSKSKKVERSHLKFCKRILKVKLNTCNASVYDELGRYPLYIHRFLRIIKFWLKLVNADNMILKTFYNQAFIDSMNGQFSYIFVNCNNIDKKLFLRELKCRVIDSYKQEWFDNLEKSPVLYLYKHVKTSLEYDCYLDLLPRCFRFYFCRLRLSGLPLRIQTGRFSRNRILAKKDIACLVII